MKLLSSPFLLCAALFLASGEPAAQRVAASRHGPTLRAASYSHAPRRVWVPGHYEVRQERVFVPGCSERVWIEPVFELRLGSCNVWVRVELVPGHWETVQHPGHYESRTVRVWVPGHYTTRSRCD